MYAQHMKALRDALGEDFKAYDLKFEIFVMGAAVAQVVRPALADFINMYVWTPFEGAVLDLFTHSQIARIPDEYIARGWSWRYADIRDGWREPTTFWAMVDQILNLD